MGAFAADALGNDAAADFLGSLLEPIAEKIEALLNDPEPRVEEIRAAGWLLSKIAENFAYDSEKIVIHLFKVLKYLNALRNNRAWLREWDDFREITTELDSEIKSVRAKLSEQAGYVVDYTENGWDMPPADWAVIMKTKIEEKTEEEVFTFFFGYRASTNSLLKDIESALNTPEGALDVWIDEESFSMTVVDKARRTKRFETGLICDARR